MARILLVDDDADVRELGRALLAHAGHETQTAESALEALSYLERRRYDVLISDVNMPTHTGFDLVRFIKKDPNQDDLTVAFLTGRRERKDIETALGLGVHDYIIKPLDPKLFLKKVADLLERRPPKDLEEEFASLKMSVPARASTNITLISISEVGLVIHSAHAFTVGSRLEVETDLFQRIGIFPPALRVASSVESTDGTCETKVSFIGADENALTKIRAWIYANTVKNRAA